MSGQAKNKGFRPNEGSPSPGYSYWETKGWLHDLDALVVGAGIVGMNAALRLKALQPQWKVLVVDRASLGGATTRNAGFACFGSPLELLEDWETLGPDGTVALVRQRWEGLKLLRGTCGDEALQYRACGATEAFTDPEHFGRAAAALPMLNEALTPVLGTAPFSITQDPQSLGLHGLAGAISSPLEGDLDTASMALALRSQLQQHGVKMLAGTAVEGLTPVDQGWVALTSQGSMQAHHVLVANNGWAANLLDLDVQTAPNTVLVSQPLPEMALPTTVHHDRGYVYAREVDGRLLIGGGRHWDCASEEERTERLVSWAQAHIHGAADMRIEHRWVGQLGVGAQRTPIVESVKPGLHVGVRLGGMGVAIGTAIGQKLAELV